MKQQERAEIAWSFDEEDRTINFGNSPVFKVFDADDFPCIEDDERGEADEWYNAQAQTAVLMLNSLLHDSGDAMPIPDPPAFQTSKDSERRLREALTVCRDVLFARIPRLHPEGPNSIEEQREYEDIGGAWSMAERALANITLARDSEERGADDRDEELTRLREALEPFACEAERKGWTVEHDRYSWQGSGLSYGDFRRASQALSGAR